MTTPPSPPNRRRRRVVVTIAVLVLGLAWWFWPRVDQRFVGTWVLKDLYEHDLKVMELFSDGTGLTFESLRELKLRKPQWQIKWHGDKGSFAIRIKRNGLYANADFVVRDLWYALDDRRCVLYDDCYKVFGQESDTFTIWNNNTVLPWMRWAKDK